MDEAILFIALIATINKTVTVIKAAMAGAWKDVRTQVVVWGVGFVALFLAAQSTVLGGWALPAVNIALGDLTVADLVLVGWVAGSSGSFAWDFKAAIDNTDSAAEPNGL